jgi:hypothetical protein
VTHPPPSSIVLESIGARKQQPSPFTVAQEDKTGQRHAKLRVFVNIIIHWLITNIRLRVQPVVDRT